MKNRTVFNSKTMGKNFPKARRSSFWTVNYSIYSVLRVVDQGKYGYVEELALEGESSEKKGVHPYIMKRIPYDYYFVVDEDGDGLGPYNREKKVEILKSHPRSHAVHATKIEQVEHAAIEMEAKIIEKRYGFAKVQFIEDHHVAVILMPKLPGQPILKDGKEQAQPFQSNQDFLKIYFKILIQTFILHKQFKIVHGDLNLKNILRDGEEVYLCDFGLSRFIGKKTSGKRGNTDYLAPELKQSISADPAHDVYSLGKIIEYYDTHLRDPSEPSLLSNKNIKKLYKEMTTENPSERISLPEAISRFVQYYNLQYAIPIQFNIEDYQSPPSPLLQKSNTKKPSSLDMMSIFRNMHAMLLPQALPISYSHFKPAKH